MPSRGSTRAIGPCIHTIERWPRIRLEGFGEEVKQDARVWSVAGFGWIKATRVPWELGDLPRFNLPTIQDRSIYPGRAAASTEPVE
jgi:hypothetical protein